MMRAAHAEGYGRKLALTLMTAGMLTSSLSSVWAQALGSPVPGYVAPVTQEQAPDYVDDTRGVFIPTHPQQRMKTEGELAVWRASSQSLQPYYAPASAKGAGYEGALNTVANGVANTDAELDRIGQDPGLLSGGAQSSDADVYAADAGVQSNMGGRLLAQNTLPASGGVDLNQYPSLATGGQARVGGSAYGDIGAAPSGPSGTDGMEIAIGHGNSSGITTAVDMQNGVVRLKEERIAVRRALQRMMDQIGAGNWTIVWDLDEQNAGLPDMEISIYAEEPFMNVLNALLGRLQSRSGQPLRVIRYDKTQRLVITDRAGGGERSTGTKPMSGTDVAVTETVLKESLVSLHYDEVPLVDALENIVNQAGKGQWRLRMYAGTDQVIKPAHIEEPFGVALERILKIFTLRYEVFSGGKLFVVTSGDRFGFRGVE